jgi:hypothetical protein
MGGNVYLITDGDYYKIGITKGDVNKRIKTLQTGSPNPITLINSYYSHNYRKIETWFHRMFRTKRLEGEWFALEPEDIDGFISEANKIDKNINNLKDNPFFK